MKLRGARGATTAEANTSEAIVEATMELLNAMVKANGIKEEEVASVTFTSTPDLSAEYPARAAGALGWDALALLGAQEVAKPGGVPRCIRVLIHWNTELAQAQIRHVYLRGAKILRPDRSVGEPHTDPGKS